jgi:heparin binding hemagglutinin HbhA
MVKTQDVRKAGEQAIEVLRTPLLAALGAGDLATQAVRDAVNKTRSRVNEYADAAQKLYQKLADQGEEALTKLKAQPQVGKAIDQLEAAIATLQDRVGDAAGDARELAEEVLGKVTRRTRSVGEKTARTAQRVAADAAEAVEELGDDVAHEVRSTSRKVANRTAPRKPATPRSTAKTNGTPKTTK